MNVPRRLILLLGISFLAACSTQKNTFVNRNFHNLNAKYNVLFNGKESYKAGMDKIETGYKENYSYVLPIYKNDDAEVAKSAGSSFDRTIEKSTKCIEKHSMKAKPKNLQKKKNLSDRDRKELEKTEYNLFIDDAYMFIGKSHFAKQDYTLAVETFKFVIKEFKTQDEIVYNAMLWLIRSYSELKNFSDANEEIEKINRRKNLKPFINAEYYAVLADFYLKQKNFGQAIVSLEKALDLEKKRKQKIRYRFILGQLYQETGQLSSAGEMYGKVIKMNPPYEMSFNAKIRLANTFSGGDAGKIRKILLDMLEDDKNKEFKDQIYFALGKMAEKENKPDDALDFYKQSTATSVNNDIQKTNSFLAIADIYFARREFRNAGNFYDSASVTMTESFPDYEQIKSKMTVLIDLVKNLNVIDLEDSLQTLAKLPKDELNRRIDKFIADYNEKERQEQIKEMQRMQELSYMQSRKDPMTAQQGGSKWYFYNVTTVQAGKKEFAVKWPGRKLEDNWRRKNKETRLVDMGGEGLAGGNSENAPKVVYTPKQREYYLENIPLNDSSLSESQTREKNSLLAAAFIYRSDLNEGKQALLLYDKLVSKYPYDEYAPLAYYQAYKLCSDLKDFACAEKNKSVILSRFANTNFAKAILDPDFLRNQQIEQNLFETHYKLAISNYKSRNFIEASRNIAIIEKDMTDHPEFYKVQYLSVLIKAANASPNDLRKALRLYINEYPGKATTQEAQATLALLDQRYPETVIEDRIEQSKAVFNSNKNEEHLLVIAVKDPVNIQQVDFNVLDLNLEYYDSLSYKNSIADLNENYKLVLVDGFKDEESYIAYYEHINREKIKIVAENDPNNTRIFLITRSNFTVLMNEKDVENYFVFFRSNYPELK